MRPKFSIIIPVYNGAKTLAYALDSIVSQSFSQYEIIIVDGKSTDKTLTIIESFSKNNPTIKINIISEKDLGIYDAMNKGIQIADGNFLYFMGCDDEFFSATVLDKVSSINDVDLIYGNVIGKITGTKYSSNSLEHVLITGIHHQGIFYNKNIFKSVGNYDIRFKIASDYHLTLKIFLNSVFNVKMIDLNISHFGETGTSSNGFDYKFYSYHYRLLHKSINISRFESSHECLNKSIYCCLYLAKNKQSLFFAWQNLMYYLFRVSDLNFKYRLSTFVNMVYWTIRPKDSNTLKKD